MAVGDGRDNVELEGHISICVPSMGNTDSSNEETEVILISSCVVPDTTGDGNGGTDHVAQNEKPLDTGTFRQNAPESEATQNSCMEIIQWTVEEQGFSREIANKIACNICGSSNKIYCGKWKQFVE